MTVAPAPGAAPPPRVNAGDEARWIVTGLSMMTILLVAGTAAWVLHADSWSLGRRSPVLNYDTTQYALAARELAHHGRLATTYALPIELAHHPRPPWPLSLVQPGMVLFEAALFRLAPEDLAIGTRSLGQWRRPDQVEWLVIPIVFTCYLLGAFLLGIATSKLLRRNVEGIGHATRMAAGAAVGLAFLLDPEAQHFAMGGYTELPFTCGLMGSLALLAFNKAPRRPLVFGLVLGITGSFRINMLWLVPLFAAAAASLAPPERRLRVLLLTVLGFAIPLAPWWLYKWQAFGTPGFDLGHYILWDGVQGRTWFTLNHLPEPPRLPHGMEAAALIARKALGNLPALALAATAGARGLWLGALVVWLATARAPRHLKVAGLTVLLVFVVGLVAGAMGSAWIRYAFPGRVVLEAAGLLALWGLIAGAPATAVSPRWSPVLRAGVAVLALAWGLSQTASGNREADRASRTRGLPATGTLLRIAVMMNREIAAGEPVMSNLGPTLAWHARRPVVHLALAPEDLDACRRQLDFRHVLLVFRDAEHAWDEWRDVVARPFEARARPELNIERVRRYDSSDGFILIWLDLGPLGGFAAAR